MIHEPNPFAHLLARIEVSSLPLEQVLSVTETSFLQAGRALEDAMNDLRGLQAIFPRLDATLGAAAASQLREQAAGIGADVGPVSQDLSDFVSETERLRAALLRIDSEVGQLDRVVRTIANVAINARIHGNALTPPRQQVTAFVQALADMASEAEAILADLKETMVSVMAEAAGMNALVHDLRQVLIGRILRAMGQLTSAGQQVDHDQDKMEATSSTLAGHMQRTFAEISRLIVALQVGDSTRQRLERVGDILGDAPRYAEAGAERAALELAAVLARAAGAQAASEVGAALTSLEEVRSAAAEAIALAGDFYLGRAGQNRAVLSGLGDDVGQLDGQLAEFANGLVAVRERSGAVETKLKVILDHEHSLRRIANSVRLSGLNAVLICAKLGRDGNALRELAQWLRALTDESDQIVERLQGRLDEARSAIRSVSRDRVDALSDGTARIVHRGTLLNGLIGNVCAVVDETAKLLGRVHGSLPRRLGAGVGSLSYFLSALPGLDALGTAIALRCFGLPQSNLPFAEDSEAAALLAGLRRRYSMQSERDLHDDFLKLALAKPAKATASANGSAADEVDDILFDAPMAAAVAAADDLDDILF